MEEFIRKMFSKGIQDLINQTIPATSEENKRLFESMNEDNYKEVSKEIVLKNVNLIPYMLRSKNIEQTDEAFQEACLAILRAIEKFDLSKGYTFSAYASNAIIRSVRRANNKRMDIPYQAYKDTLFYIQCRKDGLSDKEIEKSLTVSLKTVKQCQELIEGETQKAEIEYLRDIHAEDPIDIVVDSDCKDIIFKSIAKLTPIEQEVLILHFGLCKNETDEIPMAAIAENRKVSRQSVHIAKNRALKKLAQMKEVKELYASYMGTSSITTNR